MSYQNTLRAPLPHTASHGDEAPFPNPQTNPTREGKNTGQMHPRPQTIQTQNSTDIYLPFNEALVVSPFGFYFVFNTKQRHFSGKQFTYATKLRSVHLPTFSLFSVISRFYFIRTDGTRIHRTQAQSARFQIQFEELL